MEAINFSNGKLFLCVTFSTAWTLSQQSSVSTELKSFIFPQKSHLLCVIKNLNICIQAVNRHLDCHSLFYMSLFYMSFIVHDINAYKICLRFSKNFEENFLEEYFLNTILPSVKTFSVVLRQNIHIFAITSFHPTPKK